MDQIKGFDRSTHTEVPNGFFEILPELIGSEVKVFLAVCRKTRGWHKETDSISVSQLEEITGLSNKTIIEASHSLEEKGLIQSERAPGKTTVFEIAYVKTTQVKKQPMKKLHGTHVKSSQVTGVKTTHTKETIKQTKRNKDAPPRKPDSVESVIAFFAKNNSSEAEARSFFDHYEMQNWVRNNGMAITSWHAAASLWIRRSRSGNFPGAANDRRNDNDHLKTRAYQEFKHAD